ncbi:MAG: hypothetical protein IT344_01990 [Candidatus Dadabacteria bacterium]|nr:hypothetical protein [Candidatus Dadabacteria bacterium]
MATKAKPYDVKDFTEPVKELSRLVKETYLNTIDFSRSISEENKKMFQKQLDYALDAEKEYVSTVKDLFDKFPKEEIPFAGMDSRAFDDGLIRALEYRKQVIDSLKTMSDNVTGGSHDMAKKNVVKAFSIFDEALDSLKI